MGQSRITDGMKQEMLEMHRAGVAVREIAQEMGISEFYARSLLKQMGATMNRVASHSLVPTNISEDSALGIIEDYVNPNNPIYAILKKWSITHDTLYKILTEYEVPRRVPQMRAGTEAYTARAARLEEAVKLYMDTKTLLPLWKIYDETGISNTEIIGEIRKRGLPTRTEQGFDGRRRGRYKKALRFFPDVVNDGEEAEDLISGEY
jgi:hypothetical protein